MPTLDALVYGVRELVNSAGVAMLRRSRVKIVGAVLTDDDSIDATVLTIPTGTPVTLAGDASGLSSANTVNKVNGTAYPSGGSLTVGTVPRVTAGANVAYGAVDLANAAAVTGALPGANMAAATTGAAGSMSAADKTKLDGLQKQGASTAIAALDIDWSLGGTYSKTLAAGANVITFSNTADGLLIVVAITGAASTLTWPTVKWAAGAAPTQTASGTDLYTFVKIGATIYGSVVQAMA